MSSVRFVFPKIKLAEQLRVPGGKAVAEALDSAEANLAELQPECLDELRALADAAVACFATFPAAFAPEPLKELYAIAVRGVGIGAISGAPAADTTLISLCDLLDHLGATSRWDQEAVAVHVHTLQLLVSQAGKGMTPEAEAAILSGLKKVSQRYAQAKTADGDS
jgi:hypothetical protein